MKNERLSEDRRNESHGVKLDKLLGRDSRVPALRLTPSSFKSAILKLIGKDQIRTVQPNVSFENKVKLLEVFAESIVPDGFSPDSPSRPSTIDRSIQHEHHTTESTPDPGHEGGIQIIEQRLANDLLIDTQVRFLGETIRTPEDLAVKAMALRNPHFETFYLFALKPLNRKSDITDGNQSSSGHMMVAGVMAITNRIPCSSAAFTSQNWDEGIEEQAAFLRGAEASDYLILHNHPSGDPTPSPEDLKLTKNLSIDLMAKGFRFHGHVVINHKTFARIDQNSEIHRGTIADGILPQQLEFDPYAWPIHSTLIGIEIQKVSQIAELASKLESARIHPDNIIGFFTDAMLKTVAITVGTEQQFQSITREQLRDFGRSQGGVRLLLHAKAFTEAQAIEIIERFERMNYFERLTQMVVEIPSPEG
ncbi:MAG: hypothetical protein EON58_11865, partial [Alphaproteobacteria bacterium]